ncbi:MAG: ecotin [Draconibacterium sp.]|nr:MAG: ecotin [Draconibacterium sp.]
MKSIIYLMATMVLFSCNSPQKDHKNIQKDEATKAVKAEPMATDMFPNAKKDETQHVISLPAKDNEQDYKVEVFVTKTMKVDCNHHMLQGELLEKDLQGWGYNYYVFQTNGDVISTMMACPDKTLTKKDVASPSRLLHYNSKLPVVIYTPKGYKVKYKLWKALPDEQTAKPSTGTKENHMTLKFDSHNKLNVTNAKAKFTIYGYDSSMADVAATVIAEKEVNISEIPFSVTFDLPKNPESLIVPKMNESAIIKYYLSVNTDQEGAANIQLDHEAQEANLDLNDWTKNGVFYLKAY